MLLADVSILALNIQRSENRLITYDELVKLAELNDEEQKWVPIFWDPAYHHTMIYLSNELILNWLGYSSKDNAVADFKHKILRTRYTKNIDYFEVGYDHTIVVKYKETLLSKKAEQTDCIDVDLCNQSYNKHYYIISGSTFKDMLMNARTERSRKIRIYYLKTEALANIMVNCIHDKYNMQIREMAAKDEHIIELNKTITELRSIMESQTSKVDQLLDYAKNTNDQLESVSTQLEYASDDISSIITQSNPSLPAEYEYVHLYKHRSNPSEYNAIRCQKRSLKARTAACMAAGYEIYVHEAITPNAVGLWNKIKTIIPPHIGKAHHNSKITLVGTEAELIELITKTNTEYTES